MSRCYPPEQLAEAASGEASDELLAHLELCDDCVAILDEQAQLRTLVARVPAPTLTVEHRERLAAEVLATAEFTPVRTRRTWPLIGAAVALAAGATLVIGLARDEAPAPVVASPAPAIEPPAPTPEVAPPREPSVRTQVRTQPDGVAKLRAPNPSNPATLTGDAELERQVRGDHEVVTIARGDLTVDARRALPVHVVGGDTAVDVRRAKVRVVVTRGAVAQVSVFAGTAQVTHGGATHVIEAGTTWEPPAPTPEPAPSAAASLAFQQGWTALRAGDHVAAIAAFDRATDPIVAEDALYWAAIACERMGDSAGARQRYLALVSTHPDSPRAKQAHAALARLAP